MDDFAEVIAAIKLCGQPLIADKSVYTLVAHTIEVVDSDDAGAFTEYAHELEERIKQTAKKLDMEVAGHSEVVAVTPRAVDVGASVPQSPLHVSVTGGYSHLGEVAVFFFVPAPSKETDARQSTNMTPQNRAMDSTRPLPTRGGERAPITALSYGDGLTDRGGKPALEGATLAQEAPIQRVELGGGADSGVQRGCRANERREQRTILALRDRNSEVLVVASVIDDVIVGGMKVPAVDAVPPEEELTARRENVEILGQTEIVGRCEEAGREGTGHGTGRALEDFVELIEIRIPHKWLQQCALVDGEKVLDEVARVMALKKKKKVRC
ncbi:hypothetical protein B0H16DRAFT_1448420 [Mycena metata]|uniref:Uncharacterized protein n=1 Tax=Mycena metata TaxID=1033252 RepID=A0AAD7NXM4_9AGAR|nr:hypothetical protein B0H16DRAFT_1448420 [Mycena metata]